MLRARAAVAAALAAAAAAGAGCRDRGGEEEARDRATARAIAVEGMDAVPASADVVLGADVAALAGSPLVERAVARMLLGDPGLKVQLEKLFGGCGLNPARDLRTVLVAMDTGQGEAAAAVDRALLVASGKLSESAIAACVGKHMTATGGRLVHTQVGGRAHYHADASPDRMDVWFAFGTPDTVVVSSSPELLAEALGEAPRLASDRELAALVARARVPDAALWAAGRVAPDVAAGLVQATGGKVTAPRGMFGHVGLEPGLRVELGVEMATPADAKVAADLARQQLTALAQVAQKWKLGRVVARVVPEAVEGTVFVRLTLANEELPVVLGPIDSDAGADQNPAPPQETQGVPDHGQGEPAPGGQAPVRKQGQAD